MTNKYLVKLTPHDKFFFGGENTFGEGDSRNYFVKSNYFPQQTTLLGLIRYQLLVQSKNGIFKDNKIVSGKEKDVSELIGDSSFNINVAVFQFGQIKEISPVFIVDSNEDHLFPANKEYQFDFDKGIYAFREFNKKETNTYSNIYEFKNFIPYLEDYKAKDGLPDLLINSGRQVFDYSDVFIEQKKIGIRKYYNGKSEENAFYVQFFYKLKKGHSFAFILELEDGVKFETNELVSIGGEQSKFRMDVSEIDLEFDTIIPDYEKSVKSDKIVLVSDAFVSNEIFKDCDFAITDTFDFRSLRSSVNTKNYSKLNRDEKVHEGVSKSGKYNFFRKGSVFYGDDISKITKHFDEKIAAKGIGYNHYKIVNKKEAKL
ncbi:MAG: type III-B CRISPR module-associated Cmr3 family protein [Ignavibacteria bacterium]|jgi:CRISPR-associated protein Cmr3|nr:type III-B CRISPR module-associated Cmr3 family protein [Ignavibacteria bacterium]